MTLGNTEFSQTLAKQIRVSKIKGRWIKQRAFCRLSFAKERRKALKGKCEANLYVDVFAVR